MRRSIAVLLSGVICLSGVSLAFAQGMKVYQALAEYEKLTGKKIEKLNESPMLRIRTAAGEIPPLKQRLPEEPQIIEPIEEIGQYGGVMQLVAVSYLSYTLEQTNERIGTLTLDGKKIIPNVAKGWKLSEDYKTYTLYLRKGMKWSDGKPFTADDVLFWYEDIILNDELTPIKPEEWTPGGEPMKVRKVDDYTVRFEFSAPYPTIIETTAYQLCAYPKHYLKKYHIKYNPNADKIAKEERYDHWWQAFQWHSADPTLGEGGEDLNRPTVRPWVLKKVDAAHNRYYERNPYYWKMDTAGNQLPYIDEVALLDVATSEVVALKAMGGEATTAELGLDFSDYPVYKKNEGEGDYKICLYKPTETGSALSYAFNYTHKDPVLKKIFNDIRFRQATSLAINREEINRTVFFGKTSPYMASVPPNWTGFEDWMRTYYTEYDPQKANALLDEMGLKWDKDHQYRLRPDGETLHILIEYCLQWMGAYPTKVLELIKEYWAKVGIKVTTKQVTEHLNFERMSANEHDLCPWNTDGAGEMLARANYPLRLMPPWHWDGIDMGGPEWRKWHNTNGKEGEEPPDEIKRIFNLVGEWLATPRTEEEKYRKLTNELITLNVKGLYLIGTVRAVPWPVIIRNDLRNAVREGGLWLYSTRPDQWFLRK